MNNLKYGIIVGIQHVEYDTPVEKNEARRRVGSWVLVVSNGTYYRYAVLTGKGQNFSLGEHATFTVKAEATSAVCASIDTLSTEAVMVASKVYSSSKGE